MASKFAYFTATNRTRDIGIPKTMLKSARDVGVKEDFYLFAPVPLDGFINRLIGEAMPWRDHMAKLDFLRSMIGTDHEYVVWLDTDTYFVRHPGDLSNLIRDNKCWVSSEGDMTSPKVRRSAWWDMPLPEAVELLRGQGCVGKQVWSTNGGMWIVRREAITEFADKCEAVYAALSPGRHFSDEPCLAVASQSMNTDCDLNTVEHAGNTWACDWGGRAFKDRLPDDRPWLYEDWLTGEQTKINPAIIHAMGSKKAMRGTRKKRASHVVHSGEPVGTKLSELFLEIGINREKCEVCRDWIDAMDKWGLSGCKTYRKQILHRLVEASDGAWLDMVKCAARGYTSIGSLLDEAIKRASKT